jgi:hypothetical protein
MERESSALGVCYVVWNRPDLFRSSFNSLMRQLGDVETTICILDNGSDAETQRMIAALDGGPHRLIKMLLPVNMGIPYAINVFSAIAGQASDYAAQRVPTHVMIVDADCYFKRPVREMIDILDAHPGAAIVSGHDSVEHEATTRYNHVLHDGTAIEVKEKRVERGMCMLMRREFLAGCVPLPHRTNMDVDWELTIRHTNSALARGLKVLAVDHTVHLAPFESTWSPDAIPVSPSQFAEVDRLLEQEGLYSPQRRLKMEACRRELGLPQAPKRPAARPGLRARWSGILRTAAGRP